MQNRGCGMTPEERAAWLEVRRGVLMINTAIERLLKIGKYEPAEKSLGPGYLNSEVERAGSSPTRR